MSNELARWGAIHPLRNEVHLISLFLTTQDFLLIYCTVLEIITGTLIRERRSIIGNDQFVNCKSSHARSVRTDLKY